MSKKQNLPQLTKQEMYLTELKTLEVTSESLSIKEMDLTVPVAMAKPSITSLRSPENTPTVMAIINFAIQRASKVSAVFKEIDAELSIALTVDIMEKMSTESIEDVLLMFKYARQGVLQIDTFSKKKSFYETVLQDYVPAYLSLKSMEAEKNYQNRKTEWAKIEEEALNNEGMDDEARAKFRKLRLSLTKNPPEEKETKFKILAEAPAKSEVNSQDKLIDTLKTLCKKWDKQTLKEAIEDYNKYNDKKRYVWIFENELKSRNENL